MSLHWLRLRRARLKHNLLLENASAAIRVPLLAVLVLACSPPPGSADEARESFDLARRTLVFVERSAPRPHLATRLAALERESCYGRIKFREPVLLLPHKERPRLRPGRQADLPSDRVGNRSTCASGEDSRARLICSGSRPLSWYVSPNSPSRPSNVTLSAKRKQRNRLRPSLGEHSPNPSVPAPWFPSSSLGTRGVRSDGLGECIPRLRFALSVSLGRERYILCNSQNFTVL